MPATASVSTTPRRIDRLLLGAFAVLTGAIGLAILIAGALRIRLYLIATAEGGTPVSLLTDASVPGVPTDGDPRIVAGAFPSADLLVSGLSGGTRALLAIGEGLGVLTAVIVSGALAALFLSVARGRPFARPLTGLALAAGATLTFGSLLGQALAGFGRMNAAVELEDTLPGVFPVGFAFDPAPVLVGFAIMALAFVFRAGRRLERETEGLV